MAAGIVRRHSRGCAERSGGPCDCKAGWEASVYIARDGRKVRKTFPTQAAARSWRTQAARSVQLGTRRATTSLTVRQAAEEWLAGARSGLIRNRGKKVYKPSTIRGYEEALRLRVLPAIGAYKLAQLDSGDVQDLVDRWQEEELSPSTIANTLLPLRVIYRRARRIVPVNPTVGVELPQDEGRRDRIASPEEAARLLAALVSPERVIWSTAIYAGLRLGELRALRWEDVDLAAGVIHVRHSWDVKEGEILPKSKAGLRRVPITPRLRDELLEHRMNGCRDGLVFGRLDGSPFNSPTVRGRAARAWKAAGLTPLGLHEARHTFASLMIAAGVNAKALSTYIGHSNIAVTFDRYGHLMPGNENEAAGMLDVYLDRADTAARLAQLKEA
jgi:integrase